MRELIRRSECLIVVPVKDPRAAKTRLDTSLSPMQRADLARQLMRRSLSFLKQLQSQNNFDLCVVTGSPEVAAFATRQGIFVLDEGSQHGLNDALTLSASRAEVLGYTTLCILPADLAAPDPEDLLQLLGHFGRPDTVIVCPSTDLGTNALVVSPPTAIAFRYGPRSAKRHLDAAQEAGLAAILLPLPSLKLDIDTRDDLTHALAIAPDIQARLDARW